MGELVMPAFLGLREATVVKWLVSPGERLKPGRVALVVETSRGASLVECTRSGVLEAILVEEGATVPVGTKLAEIRDEKRPRTNGGAPSAPARTLSASPTSGRGETLAVESAAAPARTRSVSPAPVKKREARLREKPEPVREEGEASIEAPGSRRDPLGEDGASEPAPIEHPRAKPSRFETPHFHLGRTIDLDALVRRHAEEDPRVAIVAAIARALRVAKGLNGHLVDGGFEPIDEVNLRVELIRGEGLAARILARADALARHELAARLRDRSSAEGAGVLPTATVSMLGEHGIDMVFGRIRPPEVVAIGVGRVARRVFPEGESVVIHPSAQLMVTADARVVDERMAARFLELVDVFLHEAARA